MKKVLLAIFVLFFCAPGAYSDNLMIGTYKPETDFGLIDGFKWNIGKNRQGKKIIEVKADDPTEVEKAAQEKFSPRNQVMSEYELLRYMQNNVVPF